MSDQQQILPCVECGKHHEQMLMLSCLHDPCINCAAIHYVENCPRNSLNYICSKCKDQTQLDSSSVIELQRVYRTIKPQGDVKDSRKDDKKYQYNRSLPKVHREGPNGSNNYPGTTNNYPNPPNNYQNDTPSTYKYEKPIASSNSYTQPLSYQPHSPINQHYDIPTRKNTVTSSVMCVEHPEDELSYFCFTCNKPICPQCAIHGLHRQHQVQTCRKAIAAIKQRLNEANQSITVQVGNLNHKKNQTRQYTIQLTDNNKRDHELTKRQFARLKNLIQQKQDEFLRNMNDNYQRNCDQAKHYNEVLEKLIKGYTNVRQTIDSTLKKDDITVMNEYSKREYEANEIINQNSAVIQDSRIKNTRVVDWKLFEDQVNQLSGILETMKLTLVSTKNQY